MPHCTHLKSWVFSLLGTLHSFIIRLLYCLCLIVSLLLCISNVQPSFTLLKNAWPIISYFIHSKSAQCYKQAFYKGIYFLNIPKLWTCLYVGFRAFKLANVLDVWSQVQIHHQEWTKVTLFGQVSWDIKDGYTSLQFRAFAHWSLLSGCLLGHGHLREWKQYLDKYLIPRVYVLKKLLILQYPLI